MRRGFVLLLSFAAVLLFSTAAAGMEPQAFLVSEDCVKCHVQIVETFAVEGGAHAQVLCTGCHQHHPPRGGAAIPLCSECHSPGEHLHFSVDGCLLCHDPHAPRRVGFAGVENSRAACASCHPAQIKEMTSVPSRHAQMDCTACHPQHGTYFECLKCHEGHTEDMGYADCRLCHIPHRPTLVRYPIDVPSAFCAGCHSEQQILLQKTDLKHGTFECAFCHRSQHRSKPNCQTCHGEPHPREMHMKFHDCRACHNDAHYLK